MIKRYVKTYDVDRLYNGSYVYIEGKRYYVGRVDVEHLEKGMQICLEYTEVDIFGFKFIFKKPILLRYWCDYIGN